MIGSNGSAAGPELVHDLLGVGFGPSNLALAVAVEEHPHPLAALFLERKPAFSWHEGMLIDGATMQISFLKDLVTMRDPGSSFSFLAYLRARGRLVDFINHKSFYPSRVEFHDYFSWAADRVGHHVRYGTEVTGISPVRDGGVITHFRVRTRGAGDHAYLARNLVFALGLQPRLPAGVRAGERVWHNQELLHRIPALQAADPRRLVIVGAGQSAAEVGEYLHRTFPAAEICMVFSRYGFSPADDSPFANAIFDPQATEDFYTADEETKQALLRYHANTNYSVVDLELIDELYRRYYQERVVDRPRLRFLRASRLTEVDERPGSVRVTVTNAIDGSRTVLDADALVLATGYLPADHGAALHELHDVLEHDDLGRLRVDRDHRLRLGADALGRIYLQGGTEHSHGLSSSLLSIGAVRAAEILSSVTARAEAPLTLTGDHG